MKLPSGRMCAVVKNDNGTFSVSVYPASTKAEAVAILQEWISVNPHDEGVPAVLQGIEQNKVVNYESLSHGQ